MRPRRSVYLHFFDRELWEAAGGKPDRGPIHQALKILLLGTDVQLYCGLSLVWENPALRSAGNHVEATILALIELGAIEPISLHPTTEEFVETRREIYKHDRARYPLYFKKRNSTTLLGPTTGRVKTSSATLDLSRQIYSWSQGGTERINQDRSAPPSLRKAVRDALNDREDRAITYALFRPYLEKSRILSPTAQYEVRRQISKGYTAHYMNDAFGDISTGVSGLSYFDSLSVNFPDYDVGLIGIVLTALGYSEALRRPFEGNELWWKLVAGKRTFELFGRISSANINFIIQTLYIHSIEQLGGSSRLDDFFGIRNVLRNAIGQRIRSLPNPACDTPDEFFATLAMHSSAARRRIENDKEMRRAVDMVTAQIGGSAPRVLLATATPVERDTVLRFAEAIVRSPAVLEFGARRGYFRLGEIGGVDVFLVQCEMGSVGPGASLPTIGDAIDDLRPSAVIMAGIAFGVNERKQSIGEVIVGRQLQLYELAKIGTTRTGKKSITPRGDKVTASTQILSRLRLAEAGWSGKKVRYGVLLSGEKLVDNVDYRAELEAIGGEVEGGEMEGAGLYAAAVDRNIDWIIVKSICDWADGNKSRNKARRQTIAAEQSIGFVLRSLQQGGFAVMNASIRPPSP